MDGRWDWNKLYELEAFNRADLVQPDERVNGQPQGAISQSRTREFRH